MRAKRLLAPLAGVLGTAFALAFASASAGTTLPSQMTWHGGPVLHALRVHAIYWAPSGHDFPAGYTRLADAYLRDLQADGGSGANPLATVAQYRDAAGPATARASFAGGAVDHTAYPASGCPATAPGAAAGSPCLSDAQIAAEATRYATADDASGLADVYLVFLPRGVEHCLDSAGVSCAYSSYCAYHGFTGSGDQHSVIYAVIPYGAVRGCGAPSTPNGNAADLAIDNASHELAEIVTDPLGNGWFDGTGEENGDKCLTSFGPALGRTRHGRYDTAIGRGVYELQGEWSNAHGRCVQAYAGFAYSVRGASARFDAGPAAGPAGRIAGYRWSFGDRHGGSGRRPQHRYARAGIYRVTLTVIGSHGARARGSRLVRVTHATG